MRKGKLGPGRDPRARPADRRADGHQARRRLAEEPSSLQDLAQEGRALPGDRPRRSAARRRADGPRHARAVPEDVQRLGRGARRDHPRARRGRERGGRLDGRRHADAGAVAARCARCTTTSASSSRRSRTRRSIRCARRS